MWQFSAEEIDAIRLSLWVASIGVAASLPLGLLAAYALARWRFRPPVAPDGQPVPLRTSVQLRFQLED